MTKQTDSRPAVRHAVLRHFLTAVLAFAVLLRLTVRDWAPSLAALYYASPVTLILLGTIVRWLWACRAESRRMIFAWGGMTLLATGWWLAVDWKLAPSASTNDSGKTFQVLCWNVARQEDLTRVAELINRVDAEMVALVEGGDTTPARRRDLLKRCPAYDVSLLGGGLYVLAKRSSGAAALENLGFECEVRAIPVDAPGGRIMLMLVDFVSNPMYSRREPLEKLARFAGRFSEYPVVIAGDFNTPVDSVHYQQLKEQFRLTFTEAGQGYAPTWPMPLPVHQLDQIWVNEKVDVVACEHVWTLRSDHRPVLATLRLRDGTAP